MNPLSFMGSVITEDPENLVKELKKVFDVMHAIDIEIVELSAYQLKNVSRTWFDQWKEGRDDDATHPSWAYFEKAFLGHFFAKN